MEDNFTDEFFMRMALKEAQKAFDDDEVPIGAVIICQNQVIAKGYNQTQRLKDVTAHAEMIAFTAASSYLNGKYLKECTLYVTVEPCTMCAGASYWTQIDRIVVGAPEPKRGFTRLNNNILHPKTELVEGILAEECAQLMKDFFAKKRED